MLIKEYYDIGRIDASRVARYTSSEAREAMLLTGHFGPWADIEALREARIEAKFGGPFGTSMRPSTDAEREFSRALQQRLRQAGLPARKENTP